MKPPNILILMPDQMRADCLSSAGHPDIRTPHLDALAAGGISFERAYTTNPLCMPARASFLTGGFSRDHRVWRNEGRLRRARTYLHHLAEAGYHTCQLGKAHVYEHRGVRDLRRHERRLGKLGFAEVHEVTGPIGTVKTHSLVTDHWEQLGLLETFRADYARRTEAGPLDSTWPSPMPEGEALDDRICELALSFLRGHDRTAPFAAFVGFAGPHWPWDPPASWADRYDPESMAPPRPSTPPGPEVPERAAAFQRHVQDQVAPTAEQAGRIRALYYAKISHIDALVGKILGVLEERGLAENTVILFWSDHGEMLCDRGRLGKALLYEPTVRVPVILRLPRSSGSSKVSEGIRSQALVSVVDAFPTLLELGGCPAAPSRGRSLLPLARGEAQEHHAVVLAEVAGDDGFRGGRIRRRLMVRDRTHKLVVTDRGEPLMLFDLIADPDEEENLLGQGGSSAHEQRLRGHLERLARERPR